MSVVAPYLSELLLKVQHCHISNLIHVSAVIMVIKSGMPCSPFIKVRRGKEKRSVSM